MILLLIIGRIGGLTCGGGGDFLGGLIMESILDVNPKSNISSAA